MKKQIAKRLNIALEQHDWDTLQRYMETNNLDQTEAIRDLLRGWASSKGQALKLACINCGGTDLRILWEENNQ